MLTGSQVPPLTLSDGDVEHHHHVLAPADECVLFLVPAAL